MYGMVNNAIKELILAEHGDQVWQRIKKRADVVNEVFLSNEPYPDETTYRLVEASASELEMTAEAVEMFRQETFDAIMMGNQAAQTPSHARHR
jgi:hypothetical protein